MLTKLLLARKWRKLRIRVWEKRLLHQLKFISKQFPTTVQCSLRLTWAPFYGGSVVLNRRGTKAKIYIQIPYDRYITADEQLVISHFKITKHALPYFIFFHECYHLIDALSQLHLNIVSNLDEYQNTLRRAAKASTQYRLLHVEQRADDFAYRQYRDFCEKAG